MTFEVTLSLPKSLEYKGVALDLEGLDESKLASAISYLLDYGFGKSLQDSVAGVAKEMREKGHSPSEISEAIETEYLARIDGIASGTLGTRGPRLTGPDAIRREVIDQFFKDWAARKGVKLPTLKTLFNVSAKEATKKHRKELADKIAKFKAQYAAKNAAKIEAEVERRMSVTEDAGEDIDLDFND